MLEMLMLLYIESYLYIESGTVHIELYQDRFRFSPVYKLTSLYIFLINENEVYLLIVKDSELVLATFGFIVFSHCGLSMWF